MSTTRNIPGTNVGTFNRSRPPFSPVQIYFTSRPSFHKIVFNLHTGIVTPGRSDRILHSPVKTDHIGLEVRRAGTFETILCLLFYHLPVGSCCPRPVKVVTDDGGLRKDNTFLLTFLSYDIWPSTLVTPNSDQTSYRVRRVTDPFLDLSDKVRMCVSQIFTYTLA